MYLPSSELQQYRGQLSCPYCIQDLRDEDRKKEEPHIEKPKLQVLSYGETCDRCGRTLEGHVYILNGRSLCKTCLDSEQDKWGLVGGGPSGSVQRIPLQPLRRAKKKSIMESMVSEIVAIISSKGKIQKERENQIISKMPIERAKPMAETLSKKKPPKNVKIEDRNPKTEGLMKADSKPPLFESAMKKKKPFRKRTKKKQ